MEPLYQRDEIKNRVREAADIVEVIGEVVELKKAGARFTGLCPFHGEKTPSFSVNAHRQFFHCFGCGESGDVFTFVMKYHRLSFPEALRELAGRYHIELPEPRLSDQDQQRIRAREILFQVNEAAAGIYQQFLAQAADAEKARSYLADRGVSDEVIKRFRLGYAPDPESAGWSFVTSRLQGLNFPVEKIEKAGLAVSKEGGGYYDRFRDRVLFPIVNVSGQVIAFGGRILGEGQPKYLNSPESPVFDKGRQLFGLYQHKEKIRSCRKAIVVEGNFDLVLLEVHGIDNVVAPLGTALTRDHIRLLRGFCDEVILLFDGDSAGLKAAMRSVPLFLAEQVDAKVALLPEGEDPDSFVRKNGPEAVQRLVDDATHLAEFVFAELVGQYGTNLDGKNRIARELQQIISTCQDSMQRSLMISHFSEMLGIPQAQFQSGVPGSSQPSQEKKAAARVNLKDLPRKERQLLDFIIFYPEFLSELLAAHVEEAVTGSGVKQIIECLKSLADRGSLSPDQLLAALPDESEERQYVAELLVLGNQGDDDDNVQWSRLMCDELLNWLHGEIRQQDSANLLRQIREAQQTGDDDLLMTLLARKQEIGKKN